MSSKFLKNFQSLAPYGIQSLTGEACGFSMRLLCDLNHEGMEMIQNFFGGNCKFLEGAGWSGGVSSVMLPYSIFAELAAFCLLSEYNNAVIFRDGTVMGFDEEDAQRAAELIESGMYGEVVRQFKKNNNVPKSKDGSRNIHQMTGRTE